MSSVVSPAFERGVACAIRIVTTPEAIVVTRDRCPSDMPLLAEVEAFVASHRGRQAPPTSLEVVSP